MKSRRGKKFTINLQTKFTAASIAFALVLLVAITFASYFSYRNSMIDKYTENITSLVNTAASLIDPDSVQSYMGTLQDLEELNRGERTADGLFTRDEEYDRLFRDFRIIQESNHLMYLYSYVPTSLGQYVFIENDDLNYEMGKLLDSEYYSQEDIDFAQLLFAEPDTEKIYISTSQYGFIITAFEVLYNSAGQPVLVVGADMSMDKINSVMSDYLKLILLISVILIAIFIPIYLLLLRRSIINPLQVLVNSAIKFVDTGRDEKGSLTSMNVNIKTGDEIEELAHAFNQMTEDIVAYINELTTATSERERVETELRVATLIQEGMLPREFDFPGHDDIRIFGSMRAAKNVGGDFYDFFFIDKNRFCFVIGDVSGKGVPAALFMAMSKATIKDLALQDTEVSDILYRANNTLCKNNDQMMFVTLYVAILDMDTGKLTWSDGGHSEAILWKKSDGSVTEIVGEKGLAAGGIEDYEYTSNTTYIEKGDIIYVYTDGVDEAINRDVEMYGADRILSYISSCQTRNVKLLCEGIQADVDAFAGDEPQFDDITMLAIEYCDGSCTVDSCENPQTDK